MVSFHFDLHFGSWLIDNCVGCSECVETYWLILASHKLTFEKAAVQPTRAMVAAGTYCYPNSQIFVVKRTVSLQDFNVGLYVLTPFCHIIRLILNFTRRKTCSRIVRLLLSFWGPGA